MAPTWFGEGEIVGVAGVVESAGAGESGEAAVEFKGDGVGEGGGCLALDGLPRVRNQNFRTETQYGHKRRTQGEADCSNCRKRCPNGLNDLTCGMFCRTLLVHCRVGGPSS